MHDHETRPPATTHEALAREGALCLGMTLGVGLGGVEVAHSGESLACATLPEVPHPLPSNKTKRGGMGGVYTVRPKGYRVLAA